MANTKIKDLDLKTPLVASDEFPFNDVVGGDLDKKGRIDGVRITQSQITDTTITATNLNILDDGADTTLHFHDSDRARANHTGTQLLSTISDVTITAANLNILDDGVDTTLHFHDADRARANHTGTQTISTLSDLDTGIVIFSNKTIDGDVNTIIDINETQMNVSVGASGTILTSNGVGVAPTYQAATSDTPWTVDHDADGFDLNDLSNIEFRDTVGAPAFSVPAIWNDSTGMKFNEPIGDNFIWRINGVDELTLNAAGLTMTGGNLTIPSPRRILLPDANTTIGPVTNDIEYDVATGNTHRFRVNDVTEMELSATVLDLQSNDLTLGTGEINVTSGTLGDILKHTATGFLRFARGATAFQLLRVNSGATDIEYATPVYPLSLTVMATHVPEAWLNQPAALTEIFGDSDIRTKYDGTNMTQARFVVLVTTAGFAGSTLHPEYDVTSGFAELADTANQLDVAIDATGLIDSGFQTIVAASRADAELRLVGEGGNGMVDPAFTVILVEFKP